MRYLWKAIKKGFGVYLPGIREGMFLQRTACILLRNGLLQMVLEQPVQCCPQVVLFPLQPIYPCLLPSTEPVGSCLCQLQVVCCMSMPGRLDLSVGCQALQPILPDRLKHHEAQFPAFLLPLL